MAKLSVEHYFLKAKSHHKNGELAEARNLYAAVLKEFPNNKEAQQGLASLGGHQQPVAQLGPPPEIIDQLMSLYKRGQLEAVTKQTQVLTIQFPKAIALWNMLGASAAQIGQLDQAVQAFKKIISLNQNLASAHYNMGNALKDQGKLEAAIEAYNNALAIKPDYEAAHNNLVITLKSQGQPSQKRLRKALKTYNKIKIAENANFYFNKGLDLQTKGKLTEAIVSYKKALSFKPHFAEAYSNMGNVLKNQGKLEAAIAACNKALTIKPDYADAYVNKGTALQEQDKFDEAIEAYNTALSIKPDYAQAYNNMGTTLQDQGKLKEAIEAYNRALTIKPDYAQAYNNISELMKVCSYKISKSHILFDINERIKKINQVSLTEISDQNFSKILSDVLGYMSEDNLQYRTPLSQIYKRNAIDLNCKRHTEIFHTKMAIPEFCFSCIKVQVEVDTIFDLIKLTALFYELDLVKNLTTKTFIELRPNISGYYKGLIYCRGLGEAANVKEILDTKLNKSFTKKIKSQIKRGCSEFSLKFPEYGDIRDNSVTTMKYPDEWRSIENQFDKDNLLKPSHQIMPSMSVFCLSDFHIIQKWIDYAKGLKDPSCVVFEKKPIIFNEIYLIAKLRKSELEKN